MSALKPLLLAQIAATGPMRLSDYMATCLLHPAHGYYTNRPPFGAAGDFTTAPEISQMFGEMLGLCLAQAWLDQGAPRAFTLAELGPGRGTLMADVLRATRGVAGFHAAAQILLVEASPALQAVQRQKLGDYQVTWQAEIAPMPPVPLYLLANEFFDALPIRQFHREGEGWAEVVVGAKGDALVLGKTAPMDVPALRHRLDSVPLGEVVEYCPAALGVMDHLACTIAAHGGAGLIVDYGAWGGVGDTFQAMRAHGFAAPLDAPGLADLTAHVDFAALAKACTQYPLKVQFATQAAFLNNLGIGARAARLAQKLADNALAQHLAAKDRLTNPAQMGELFKILGLLPQSAPPLAGFSTEALQTLG